MTRTSVPPRRSWVRLRLSYPGMLFVVLACTLIWCALGRLSDLTVSFRLRTTPARWGVLEERWVGTALAMRRETVVHAPTGGRLTLLVREGERVRPGDVICKIDAGNLQRATSGRTGSTRHLVRATNSGLVSFRIDGLENALAPDTPLHALATIRSQEHEVRRIDNQSVNRGEPLFRLVDNFEWFLFVSVTGTRSLQVNETVRVSLLETETTMRVERSETRNGKTLALLHGDSMRPEHLYTRWCTVALSQGRCEGVLVPDSSLVKDGDGELAGVYLMVEGKPVFKRIRVVASRDEMAVVEGVPVETPVVTNPALLRPSAR